MYFTLECLFKETLISIVFSLIPDFFKISFILMDGAGLAAIFMH